MRIGLVYVKGAVPAFENFGNLPTDLVDKNGMVGGVKAHDVLDGLIIPGGSIVESESLTPEISREIKLMAADGKFILGICSGFQVLSNKIDIGRKSPCPIEKKGLGLLDVSFSPMISNDRVEAEIIGESFLTRGLVGETINGFHCHTYGHIIENNSDNINPILYSTIKRVNYADDNRKVLAGVSNAEGNVVGCMVHGCLDNNPELVENILKYLGATEEDRLQISKDNEVLVESIKNQLGIETGLSIEKIKKESKSPDMNELPPMIMMGSTGSDSGKTFLVTGLAGALRKKGLKVGVLKVGPDVRDIVPALYLTKEKMEDHSSIKIGHLGWMDLENVLKNLKSFNYDLVIIEGVMSVFTGLLNEKIPYSSAEIALAAKIPVILVSGCSKGGIETAGMDLASHRNMLLKMGVEVPGVIFNRVYDSDIYQKTSNIFKNKEELVKGLELISEVPKVKLSKRGGTPEVEIKLEEFCLKALETVENNLDIYKILNLAKKPVFNGYTSLEEIERAFNL